MARKQARNKKFTLPVRELEHLIEEATVDAYGESEEATGLLTMIDDNVELPFETEVLGTRVSVVEFDIDDRDQVIAICERGGTRRSIELAELPLPSPRAPGTEWIEAYCYWRRRSAGLE